MRALAVLPPPASSSSTHRGEGNTAQAEPFHVSAAKVNGAQPRRPGRAPRHDYAAVLPQALSEGAKLEAIAASLGVSTAFVHKQAHRLGLGHLTPKARRAARVMDLFGQGYSLPEIADQVGCCTDTVRLIVKRAGRYDRAVEYRNTGAISRQDRAALRGTPP